MTDMDAAFWTWLARGCRKPDLVVLMHASLMKSETVQSAGSQEEEIKIVSIQTDKLNKDDFEDDFEPYDEDDEETVKVVRVS